VSFTPVQRFIAQLTLEAIADLGFALGGGQALHAHGYGERLSRDLDFYIPQFEQDLFDRAEVATLAALRAHGYTAEVGHCDTWLRQILVTDPTSGERIVLDLEQDYRQNPPVPSQASARSSTYQMRPRPSPCPERSARRPRLPGHPRPAEPHALDAGPPVRRAPGSPAADHHRRGVRG
jgi:hypothetical protein